jgi:DegV family protein with EDD domain
MERDRRVAVVTDSGSSMLPKSPEAIRAGVTVIPLEVKFFEGGKYVPYSDADVSTENFYERMRSGEKLPETTGALPGRFVEVYKDLKERVDSVISIHITSKHSGVWQSAVTAKDIVTNLPGPKTEFEIVDTGQVSLASWFAAEAAGLASLKGANLNQIKDEVMEVVKNSQLFVTLATFENLKKGGRGKDILKAVLASVLSIYPVIGFEKGELKNFAYTRSVQKARNQMIEMVGDAGKLVKLAVIHANVPELAEKTKETLKSVFAGDIAVYNITGALAVHAGEGALGVALQKA